MNIARLLGAFLVFGFFGNFVICTNWVDDLTGYIVEDSGARQVVLLTNLEENETTTSPLIDHICYKLLEKIPVLKINTPKDFNASEHTPPNTDTTATFFLLVHESPETPLILPSKNFIQAVVKMATLHYEPKYLILFIGAVRCDSFKELLEYAWTMKLLDLTIVEWVQSKGLQVTKTAGYQFNLPIIHQFNPFKNEYTKRKWTGSNIQLFPNKVNNMWGFSLRIATYDLAPFTIGKFNEKDEVIEVGGANIQLLQIIAQAMNATLKFIRPRFFAARSEFPSETDYLYYNGGLQGIDITSFIFVASDSSAYSSLRTAPVIYDDFCPVVPIQTEVKGPNFTQLIEAYSLSIFTVTILWILSRALRFSSRIWGAFYIARLFFGVTVVQQPRKNVERIVFASLLVVSAIYASSIYNAMTDFSLRSTEEKEYYTVEDLDESGLKPIMSPFNFNRTFHGAEGSLLNLMSKVTLTGFSGNSINCVKHAAQGKNVMCLMRKAKGAIAVARSEHDGRRRVKVSKACFWSDDFAFPLNGNLPYRSKIDEHIRSMTSAGLMKKLYHEEKFENSESPKNIEQALASEEEKNKPALHHHLLAIAVVGYSTSLLVFIIEIIVHRISKYRKSKVQPVYFPYTE